MSDPRLLTLFVAVFILLGLYSVNTGLRRLREARAREQPVRWYKQVNLLTGYEYLLLSLVFLISLGIRNNTFPNSLKGLVVPLYLVVLLSSATLAGIVIRQAILNARKGQGNAATPTVGNRDRERFVSRDAVVESAETEETAEQRAENLRVRRLRRQKAAAARRRKAGKT